MSRSRYRLDLVPASLIAFVPRASLETVGGRVPRWHGGYDSAWGSDSNSAAAGECRIHGHPWGCVRVRCSSIISRGSQHAGCGSLMVAPAVLGPRLSHPGRSSYPTTADSTSPTVVTPDRTFVTPSSISRLRLPPARAIDAISGPDLRSMIPCRSASSTHSSS